MRHLVPSALGIIVFACQSSMTLAQVSDAAASRMGLETAWKSQVQMPRFGSGISSTHLWTDTSESRRFAVVELPSRTIRIAADKLDRDGNPIGIEGAKKQAQIYAARLLGKSDGIDVLEVTVPSLKLVVVTHDGLVQAMDAETGKLLWASACGQSTAPAHPAAVSSAGISVIHGQELFLLDWKTGKHRIRKQLRHATSNAVAVCDDLAFVSDFSGRILPYPLSDAEPIVDWGYVITGRAVGQPVSSADQAFCAIASDRGYVYVFSKGEEPSVWLRFNSSAPMTGSLAVGNGAFYCGNVGGVISKFTTEDRLGRVAWSFRTGRTTTAPPLIYGDSVYVASEAGDIVVINDQDGLERWRLDGESIASPIAHAGKNVFCTSFSGELVAINSETGRLVGRSSPMTLARPIVNQTSDRIYLVSAGGQLQCLRPIGELLPNFVTPPAIPVEGEDPNSLTPETEAGGGDLSPFDVDMGSEAGANPFDTGEAAEGASPFGSSPFADPDGSDTSGTGGSPFGDSPF